MVVLTRHPSASPLRRHHRGRGVEGAGGGVERHPVRRWKWRRGERRRVRWPSEVEAFQDALTHLLHFGDQLGLKRHELIRTTADKHIVTSVNSMNSSRCLEEVVPSFLAWPKIFTTRARTKNICLFRFRRKAQHVIFTVRQL